MPAITSASLLKQSYGSVLNYSENTNNPVSKLFKYATKEMEGGTWGGSEHLEAILLTQGQGGVVTRERGRLPDATPPVAGTLRMTPKKWTYSMEMSPEDIDDTKNPSKAFVSIMSLNMKNAMGNYAAECSRMIHGNGSGFICQATAALGIGGTALTVKNAYADVNPVGGARNLRRGMILAVVDAGNTTLLGNVQIDSVPKTVNGTNVTLIPTTFAIPIDAIFYRSPSLSTTNILDISKDNEPTGLKRIVNDDVGFADYFTLNRVVNPEICSTVFLGVGALSGDIFQRAFSTMQGLGTESSLDYATTKVCVEPSVARAIAAITTANQRFTMDYIKNPDPLSNLAGGRQNITIGGFEVLPDRCAPYGTVVILNTKGLKKIGRSGTWRDETGDIFVRGEDRRDTLIADWQIRVQYYHVDPKTCVRMEGAAVSQVYIPSF